jgi:membrane protein implicated in regulation of membrane protease activity
MSWQQFYLGAFLVGFLWSAISFLAGAIHMPHFHFHGHAYGHGAFAKGGVRSSGLSPFNFGTAAAFLAWFGGTGYLLERYSNIWAYLGLFVSLMSGLGGAAVVFWFLAKLIRHDEQLDPADYEMVGVLGRVASPIRSGRTGELIYSRAGTRRAAAARSEDGAEIPRDTEVIVTRYDKGIAYVRRWEEMSGEKFE